MKIKLRTLFILLFVSIISVTAMLISVAQAVEVEPTYNNPTSFEEKKKEEVDEEPACD